jgi:hypothetical protein
MAFKKPTRQIPRIIREGILLTHERKLPNEFLDHFSGAGELYPNVVRQSVGDYRSEWEGS